ncbi:hypothetical protein A2U01_0010160 [Trifolium medium]|uniref:Uncharacterized protein n=1 Tax=Trifolium medium TaxID=97028 RepID=A0A392MP06_9FABA|nr:hypothetical protein [Trifolium medium]
MKINFGQALSLAFAWRAPGDTGPESSRISATDGDSLAQRGYMSPGDIMPRFGAQPSNLALVTPKIHPN